MAKDYEKISNDLEQRLNTEYNHFDYKAEEDELFQLQRKQLERNQQAGVSDILAQYAANTGMGGSTAAMAAAQQTSSEYNAMIADALSVAENRAYQRWAAEKADLQNQLAYAQDMHAQEQAQAAAWAAAQSSAAANIGANGMSKSQYDDEMNYYLKLYTASDDEETKAELLLKMEDLRKGYYGDYTTEDYQTLISATEANDLLNKANNNDMYLSESDYNKLVQYYNVNPYEGLRGAAVLHAFGYKIAPSQTETAPSQTVTVEDTSGRSRVDVLIGTFNTATGRRKSEARAELMDIMKTYPPEEQNRIANALGLSNSELTQIIRKENGFSNNYNSILSKPYGNW